MWISALVTLLNLALAATVGVRLLLRSRDGGSGPETWLAGYFLCGACVGSLLNIAVYSSLGGEGLGLALGDALAVGMLAVSTLLNGVAGTCVYLFTWRTFRSDAGWARALVGLAAAVFAGTWLLRAATGGFAVVVLPGPAYWVERAAFYGAFLWAAIESLRYWSGLRRRARVGLADPVLANRFWLWGLWATATGTLAFSDLVARIAYVWRTGETAVLLVDQAMPIIVVTVAITALVGAVAAASLWLTFFPSTRYVAWIEARHARV